MLDITKVTATPEATAAGIEQLCAWAVSVQLADIPQPIMRRALIVLCDDIAAIVAARDEPEVARAQDRLCAKPGERNATVFRGGRPMADRFSAAVANGIAADWCELDEGYRRATCHAGLYTIPALIADAEASGATVADVTRALVIGYEIAGRFARAFPFKRLVLHPHASLAAVGAAAGVAALRRHDAATFIAAVSAASTMVAPGPYTHAVEGALVRNVWPAAGAWCGMQAVEWAECGIGGLASSPYHVFAAAFGSEPLLDQLTAGLGEEWAVADGYHKVHACCQYSHSAVEATLEALGNGSRPAPESITRVIVETHRLCMTLDNRAPATTLAAKFSMPHILAATCTLGHAGAEAFASTTLTDGVIGAVRDRIELRPFEPEMAWPKDRPARVTLELADGTRRTALCESARGGPDRPFSTAEILAKVEGITGAVYPRFIGTAKTLIAAEPDVLRAQWGDIVAELTAG
jgi:2-methylcitrate dehydratase PrpD